MMTCAAATAQAQDTQPAPNTTTVTEVTVTGKTPGALNRIDRRVYTVKTDPDAQTGVAADVLAKVPSVQVTPSGAVTLRGDANVYVMIDGKYPNNGAAAIQTLSAADIDRIEVMTNPSAQYAPDGTAGIINIITKRHHVFGVRGNLNVRASTLGHLNVAPSLTATKGRWTIEGRVGWSRTPNHGDRETVRTVPTTVTTIDHYAAQSESALASLSLAYKATNYSTFTLVARGFRIGSKTDSAGSYRSAALSYDRTIPASFNYGQSGVEGTYEYINDKTGGHLTIDLDHSDSRAIERDRETDLYADGSRAIYGHLSTGKGPHDILSVDYEHRYDDGRQLTAGGGIDREQLTTDTSYVSLGQIAGPVANGLRSLFPITRTISSAYVTHQVPVGKWTVLPGLRVETEQRDIDQGAGTLTITQTKWFPSLHLERPLSADSKLKLSYSRRAQRPTLDRYDPGPGYVSASGQFIGNPFLQPTLTDSYEAEYSRSHKATSYTAALFYRESNGLFANITTVRADGFATLQTVNTGHSHSGGVELTLRAPLSRSWKVSINTNLSNVQLVRLDDTVHDYFSYSGNGQVEWNGRKGDQFQANLTVTGRVYDTQGYTGATSRLDLNWQHPLNKTVAIVANLIDVTNSQSVTTVINSPTLKSRTFSRPSDQMLRLGLSWKFDAAKK